MPQTKLYNQEGNVIGTADLPDSIFNVTPGQQLVRRAVEAQQQNARVARAHTKTRSEVRGGGRKPWRQKGTGRARHGSIRSPIWIGGGVTFGPRKDRNFSVSLNKKERRKALFMGLTAKVKDDKLVVLDRLSLPSIKTKQFAAILSKLPAKNRSTLVVQPQKDETIMKSARNLPKVSTIAARSLNIVDVLRHEYLLLPQESVKVLEATYHIAKESP